mmetsp:Transcript_589/g.1644  ORF Transcript_589/g.1644 Transcript_589/m.1644 type:complete len:295 (+) Transcript_589:339-1223(+)
MPGGPGRAHGRHGRGGPVLSGGGAGGVHEEHAGRAHGAGRRAGGGRGHAARGGGGRDEGGCIQGAGAGPQGGGGGGGGGAAEGGAEPGGGGGGAGQGACGPGRVRARAVGGSARDQGQGDGGAGQGGASVPAAGGRLAQGGGGGVHGDAEPDQEQPHAAERRPRVGAVGGGCREVHFQPAGPRAARLWLLHGARCSRRRVRCGGGLGATAGRGPGHSPGRGQGHPLPRRHRAPHVQGWHLGPRVACGPCARHQRPARRAHPRGEARHRQPVPGPGAEQGPRQRAHSQAGGAPGH